MGAKRFEVLGHTADLRLRVFGATREDLFRNAAAGLAFILKPGAEGGGLKKAIEIRSANADVLLVDFLNQVLSVSQINKAVYPEARVLRLTDTALRAEISGAPVDGFDEDVKAVSYHNAAISQDQKGDWQAELVFDI